MDDDVRLSRLRPVLESLDYPLSNAAVRTELSDVTLVYADGEEALAAVLERSSDDRFEGVDDLQAEIYNNLPVEAVGEPGQSEGDA
jgi:hypothetical protein